MKNISKLDVLQAAWQDEFNLLDDENRSRMYQRRRAHCAALARAGATPTTVTRSAIPKQLKDLAGFNDALLPVLASGAIALTRHANHRMKNRGITPEQVLTVSLFGKEERSFGGATRHYLDKKARKLLSEELPHDAIRKLGKLDIVAVFSTSGALITATHRTRRARTNDS